MWITDQNPYNRRFLKAKQSAKVLVTTWLRIGVYNPDKTVQKDFVLNDPTYMVKILVGAKNFGSGLLGSYACLGGL